MTMAALYPTKEALKESIGQQLEYRETSWFGAEYPVSGDGKFCVVGPDEHQREWFAEVTMRNHRIEKVS